MKALFVLATLISLNSWATITINHECRDNAGRVISWEARPSRELYRALSFFVNGQDISFKETSALSSFATNKIALLAKNAKGEMIQIHADRIIADDNEVRTLEGTLELSLADLEGKVTELNRVTTNVKCSVYGDI